MTSRWGTNSLFFWASWRRFRVALGDCGETTPSTGDSHNTTPSFEWRSAVFTAPMNFTFACAVTSVVCPLASGWRTAPARMTYINSRRSGPGEPIRRDSPWSDQGFAPLAPGHRYTRSAGTDTRPQISDIFWGGR